MMVLNKTVKIRKKRIKIYFDNILLLFLFDWHFHSLFNIKCFKSYLELCGTIPYPENNFDFTRLLDYERRQQFICGGLGDERATDCVD